MPEKIDPKSTMFFNNETTVHKNSVLGEISIIKHQAYKFQAQKELSSWLNDNSVNHINEIIGEKDSLN